MLMIIGMIFCTSDITQLVCGMSAQGAFVCFVVHIVCQVDVIVYSGLEICGILVANPTMFSHLLPGFSCGSK